MKRLIACLLALTLLTTPCVQAAAVDSGFYSVAEITEEESIDSPSKDDASSEDVVEPPEDEDTDTSPEDTLKPPEDLPPVKETDFGQLGVVIKEGLLLNKDVVFTVSLVPLKIDWPSQGETTQPEAGRSGNRNITLPAGGKTGVTQRAAADFADLPVGTYTLTITSPGFASHSQTVEVKKNRAVKFEFYTGMLSGYTYENGAAHPGILLTGDVNGDGKLTSTDSTMLVDRLNGVSKAVSYADLNLDGTVDLLDLEYLAKALRANDLDTDGAPVYAVPSSALTAEIGTDTTIVKGSVEQMLAGMQPLSLQPSDGSAISDNRPVTLEVTLEETVGSDQVEGLVIQSPADNAITQAALTIDYVDQDGQNRSVEVPVVSNLHFLLESEDVTVTANGDGSIVINLGSQVAVKKVTIRITGTRKNNNLAEISSVEFLNDLASRIPEPALDRPENVIATPGSQKFSLSWDACKNVTGYEVVITDKTGKQTDPIAVKANVLDVASFGNDKLVNYDTYKVQVRSTNGSWRSPYSETVEVTPQPSKKPDPPDNVKAVGAYRSSRSKAALSG